MNTLELIKIDPSKKIFQFLEKRIRSDNYRGNQLSQHNRYDLKLVKKTLKLLYDYSGMDLMQIRDTDLSKRPFNNEGEKTYAEYVNSISLEVKRGTQDSVRKNLFVDFHRMGFIFRYDEYKKIILPYERKHVKYVSLSKLGKEFAFNDNLFETNILYSRGIDNLLKGIIDDLMYLILYLNKLTIDEYTFFVSFLNIEMDGEYYGKDHIIDMIKEYRSLSRYTKDALRNSIKNYCNPDNFSGDKTKKRDFHNWINESQQVFMLLNQTVFFEKRENTIFAKIGVNAIYDTSEKLNRSLAEKLKYYTYHSVKKKIGFELHHVVPLSWSRNRNEYAVLDNHKNLVYIDGYSHSKITQNRNLNVIIDFIDQDIIFSDYNDSKVHCKNVDQILYNPKNQSEMKNYNISILNSL